MKRYKHTWFNGMLEDPKGTWIKENEASKILSYWVVNQKKLEQIIESQQFDWYELHKKYSDLKIINLLLTAGLLFLLFFNILQLFYYLN